MVNAVKKALPEARVIYREDRDNLPYGNKTPEELLTLVLPILQQMVKDGVEAIVIACNTVTTTIIEDLRNRLPVPLVGMEPMVKPAAAATKSKVIAVCATPTTLASKRYKWLVENYAPGVTVLEPDCSDWAYLIETKQPDRQKIHDEIEEVCKRGADVIVLGCTHYHWIEEEIKRTVQGRAEVLQPEGPVIEQLKRVIGQRP